MEGKDFRWGWRKAGEQGLILHFFFPKFREYKNIITKKIFQEIFRI